MSKPQLQHRKKKKPLPPQRMLSLRILKEETEEAEEKQSKASKEKEVDYTALDIEGLIDAYRNLSTGELWLKQHKTLQTINTLFEEKLKADVDGKKKLFLEEGGNEIDFFFKPEYKNRFDQIRYEYRKKRRTHFKEQEAAQKVNSERKKNYNRRD